MAADCPPIINYVDKASFNILSKKEIKQISVKKLTEPKSFEKAGKLNEEGLYSRALGPIKRFELCTTCHQSDIYCPGHYGHVELSLPVYHPMLVQTMYQILTKACLDCYRFRMSPPDLILFLAQLEALNCGFDHLVDHLSETAKDLCRGEKPSEYMNSVLKARLDQMLQDEREKVPNFECQQRPQQRSIVERLSQLFRNFINGKLIKPQKLCPHCNEKKTTTSLHDQSVILIGANVGKTLGKSAKTKSTKQQGESHSAKTTDNLHYLKTDEKKILTPVGVRHIFRKLWETEKKTMKRIFHFLDFDHKVELIDDRSLDKETDLKKRLKQESDIFVPTDLFFIDTILVPPPKFRPPMTQQGYSFEGPRTAAISAVMKNSVVVGNCLDNMIKEVDEVEAEKMQPKLQTYWKELQISVHCLYDNEMDKYGQRKYPGLKQLIDKKEGLFRKNMMGKRVNFAARSVISPDPNISVDQIGVPLVFAKVLTYPQPVTAWNIEELRQAVKNGPHNYPGACSIVTDDGITISLTKESVRMNIANRLNHFPRNPRFSRTNKVGPQVTIVNRHLLSGDVLLFNRQPTLHKPSIMAFRARVLPNEKGFRLHYANCKSFNADFDGDEMNAHLPQSELARSEAYNIASVNYQYLVPKDGSPLGGLIQDHVVAVCIMTRRDQFYDKEHYDQLCFCALNFMEKQIKLEPPAIIKPVPLWTGKQVITTIIRNCTPAGKCPPTLKIKSKVGPKIMHVKPEFEQLSDCHVYIKDGELLTGLMDKSNVGATQYGLVHTCYELYGGRTSSDMMSAFARLSTWFLQLYEGFTLGIADILVEDDAEQDRFDIIKKSLTVGNESAAEALNLAGKFLDDSQLEDKLREAHSDRDPLPMKKLDAAMKKRTDDISSSISNRCLPEGLIVRFPHNNLQMMIQSGAKGGTVNALQISCLLGQIELEGRRVPLSMSGRSLPSFKPYDTSPKAGGFVSGRFLTGIQPQEFFFHCMAGREGLIDTAVKTSRSGYLQRCLIKHLEGLTVHYDQTVRDSCGSVVQFLYGEDGLDITRCQMLKDKAFSSLIDNYKIIKPSDEELQMLNKAKEVYEEDVITRTEDIQQWVEKNGNDRVRRLRGSGFLDFQAFILKNPTEHEKVFGHYNRPLGPAQEIDLTGPDIDINMETQLGTTSIPPIKQETGDHEITTISDCDVSGDSSSFVKNESATEVPTSATQMLVASTPTWKKDMILQAWYALSFKEKRKWNRDWDLCPDPLTALMNPGSHYGVVPEKLDERIEEFVRENPHLVMNPASLIGCFNDDPSGGGSMDQETFIDCDTNPELSNTLHNLYKQVHTGRSKPKITKHEFYNLCYNLYMKMLAQPGEAVGLLAAQSIGEPSTQMTLNTFHFAGRGEMNVTLGIPRLREILMTASANIGTPSMDLPLLPVLYDEQGYELNEEETENQAMEVKLALNAVRLSDVLEYVDITEQLIDHVTCQKPASQGRRTLGRKRMKIDNKTESRAIQYTFVFSFLPSKYYRHEFTTTSKQIMHFMDNVFKNQLIDTITKRQRRLEQAELLFDQSSRRRREEVEDPAGNQAVDGEEQEGDLHEHGAASEDELTDEGQETEADDDDGPANSSGLKSNPEKVDQIVNSKHKYTLVFTVKQMATRLDMGSLIKAEARRTFIHRVGNIQRALIVKDLSAKARGAKCDKMIKTEGVSLLSLVRFGHIIDLNAIYSNDIHAIARTYGIEAAGQAIRREMANVFAVYGIEVDPRHLSLIADYMTYNGSIRGMNRMSMEASASPFQQMSYESTLRYLKWAAILGLSDDIKSPSAALVFGRPTKGGTGLFTTRTSPISKPTYSAPKPPCPTEPELTW
uniref:DNA-directed RNA polymerase subunit n=2 Tax=Aceria tosichella TaxID=561515 RepID=A0A6G1SD80_9ACAR